MSAKEIVTALTTGVAIFGLEPRRTSDNNGPTPADRPPFMTTRRRHRYQ